MMKPFVATPLKPDEQVFNYHLSHARQCLENTLGILASHCGFLLTALRQELQNVQIIALACVTLHNIRDGKG